MHDRSDTPAKSASHSTARRGRRTLALGLCALALLPRSTAHAGPSCKPMLSILEARAFRVSPIQPYTWKATVLADAHFCATTSGMFEIDFVRAAEVGPDLQMTEAFRWRAGQFKIELELGADEWVLEHRIGFIAPCVCRDPPFDGPPFK